VLGNGDVRTVRIAYAVPAGTSVRLLERAKGINHTIAAHVRGRRCPEAAGNLAVAFSSSLGASRYSVSAKLSDGRELAFDLGGGCRALRIANVPAGVAAVVKIAGLRYDLAMGRPRTLSIKANARSIGRIGKKWPPGKVCS
jgi:hypothetical protein